MSSVRQNQLLLVLGLIITFLTPALAQDGVKGRSAQKVIDQARAAVGGEAKLSAIKSLSASFKFRRLAANGEQRSGELQLDFLLPDKFAMKEVRDLPRNLGQVITHSLLNGQQPWLDVRTTTSEVPVVSVTKGDTTKEQSLLLQRLRKEQALYLLQLMIMTPASFPLEFTYIGEAEAEDGRADVVEARGVNDFIVRLFFDKETHRLLLLSYREPAPEQLILTPRQSGQGSAQLQQNTQGDAEKRQDIEVQLRFSDYRVEDGFYLPHLIIREKGGKVDQEMELKGFKINPPFKPEHFEIKAKK